MSESVRRARWVEAETIHLKRMGLSFDKIAEQITRVGRGESQALVATSEPIVFPPEYQISRQACFKAFRKAIVREPALELEELRKIDYARSEEMYLNLQPALRKGDPRATNTAIRLLDHTARVSGYSAPQQAESEATGAYIDTTGRAVSEEEFDRRLFLIRDAVKVLRDLGVPIDVEPTVEALPRPNDGREQPLLLSGTDSPSTSEVNGPEAES